MPNLQNPCARAHEESAEPAEPLRARVRETASFPPARACVKVLQVRQPPFGRATHSLCPGDERE